MLWHNERHTVSKIVSIKAAVPANALGAYGDTEDKTVREAAAKAAEGHIRTAVESAASSVYGVSVGDFTTKYTRKGNVKASFTVNGTNGASDREVQDRVIAALNPVSQRAGASNLDVQVADLDA